MKNTVKFLLAIVISLSFASCQKEIPTKMTGYFYTTDVPTSEVQYRLFVDGVDKGVLPYINQPFETADPNDSTMRANSLKVEFMSGVHLFESRKAEGGLVASSEMEFYFTKNKTGSKVYSPKGASGSKSYNSPQVHLIWLASKM